jgi:uncharacterized membrane protein
MSEDLLIITFPSESAAKQGSGRLLEMEKENLIAIQDAVVVAKEANGGISLSQLSGPEKLWEIRAAASGNPAPTGAGALTDFGADNRFIRDIAEALPDGVVAIFVLVWKVDAEKVTEGLLRFHGTVLRTSFDKSAVEAIRSSLAARAP